MNIDKRWSVYDRYSNNIYISEERWEHIIDSENHPEMEDCEDDLKQTIRSGRRTQDALNPQKYRYIKAFDDLPFGNTHIVAVVLCRFKEGDNGQPTPNNYVVTAYQKVMG